MSPRWSSGLLVLAVLAMATGLFASPMGIASGDGFRDNDWLNCRSFDVQSRIALLEHHQFPLRSHLVGGGFPTIAHPSDGSWAPTLLAVLLFGDVIGVKVNVLILLLVGGWGVLRLGRVLGLAERGAAFAALAFVLSGWLPSMLLVGFYNQAFFLLAPAIAALLLESPGRPARLLWAGLLLAFVLQQGGHAFPATCFFLGLVVWLGALDRSLLPLVGLLLLLAPPAFARELVAVWPLVLGWGAALVLLATQRAFVARLLPVAARLLLVLAIACSLGAARIVGLDWLGEQGGSYEHTLVRTDATWFPDVDGPSLAEERFYEGVEPFLVSLWARVPSEGRYGATWGRLGDPLDYEYSYLGLTPGVMALLFLGLFFGWREPRRRVATLVFVAFSGICFGWHLPVDLHFLMTWGVPTLDAFSQPLKYWNFFVLLGGVLLAGVAVDRLPSGRWVLVALGLVLLWPLIQNRQALAEQFAEPVADVEVEPFHQVALVAEPSWLDFEDADIREMGAELFLRDYGRPALATEYVNSRRGVGTIDHYGSMVLGEAAVPRRYVTLDGAVLDNPRYRGEAWSDAGTVGAVRVRPNDVEVDVVMHGAGRLVVNQSWLPGFTVDRGVLLDEGGLLAVDLPAGAQTVSFRFAPRKLLAGLAWSGGTALLWVFALVWTRRRS